MSPPDGERRPRQGASVTSENIDSPQSNSLPRNIQGQTPALERVGDIVFRVLARLAAVAGQVAL